MTGTSGKNLMMGIGIWLILLTLPILLLTIDNSWSRVVLMSIYPIFIALISRQNPFYISMDIIMGVSIAMGLFYVAVNQNKNVKKALKNPSENKAVAHSVMWSVVVIFLILIGIIGKRHLIFNPYNFVKKSTA
jgi:hypothetical protein